VVALSDSTGRPLAVVVATGYSEYQQRLLRGISPVLEEAGITPLVHAHDPFAPGLPASLVDLLRRARPRGAVVTNFVSRSQETELLGLARELGVPTIGVGLSPPGGTCVRGDSEGGMRSLLGHLFDECGVRRPALIRGRSHQGDAALRERVFRTELALRGLTVNEDLVLTGDLGQDHAYRHVRRLVARGRTFDAVVAFNDVAALGALAALEDEGIRVPEDVRITGYDNGDAAALHWPGLTTVDQDLEGQGAAAARQLLALVAGGRTPAEVLVPARIVIRGSTAAACEPGQTPADQVVVAARTARRLFGAQDAVIGLNRAMIRCRSLDEIVDALSASRLDRLGVPRCFLALYDTAPTVLGPARLARLALDYRDGDRFPVPRRPFPVHRLLPETLQDQLHQGPLVLQPLSVGERAFGYVLFEQTRGLSIACEALRVDLSRTIGAVFAAAELRAHATGLERLVAGRTRELEAEVLTRRRTEQELHAEVLTRRRTEHELHRINATLQRSLMLDGLTRIGNRTAFERHLDRHWPRENADSGEARPRGLVLLMVDVDHFKAYNDHLGHVSGDEALRTIARCLRGALHRPDDLACRYGGEEFAVILPDSDVEAGLAVARRFRALLAGAAIPHPASTVASVVTTSVGLAHVEGERAMAMSTADLVDAADRALYRAKTAGRDRVVVAGASRPTTSDAGES